MRGGQGMAVAFTLLAAAVMIALHDSDRGRAITYAAGQAIIMLTCLVHLLRNRLPGIGTIISATAFAIAMLGQIMVVTSNVAVLADALDYEVYYALASYALLCTVFSAAIWNLGFAMMAIDGLHQKLTHLSETDDLTGLANRRAFRTALEDMQQRALTGTDAYSVVLIDLNDFKPLNDNFGHAAGDAALQHFARLLGECTRHGDLVARLGGDEFSLLLPDTTAAQARDIAEDIKRQVAATPLFLSGHTLTLSASLGVASSGEDEGDLVILADGRLYKDKREHKTSKRQRPASRLHLVKTT
jgi:diguanylate cyclase (GGDEF)-like protein